MLVVIDTSALISGVLWTGLPHRLIELAEAGQITLCATEETLVELREVLARPKFAIKIRDRLTSVEEIMQSVLALVALYLSSRLLALWRPTRATTRSSLVLSAQGQNISSAVMIISWT